MNYLQFIMFLFYGLSVLICGIFLYGMINPKKNDFINFSLYAGESFLLGSLFSILGLYSGPCLWGLVFINYGPLFFKQVRNALKGFWEALWKFSIPKTIFIGLLLIFIFRNLYFLVDVDSHSTYLFAQKLWLAKGSSILGDIATDIRIFAPHFNAVPYALGLAISSGDTLFPQLVVASWSVVVLLLVYGYVSYRLNQWYGVASVMLVLFDEQFFYSGANSCCIINSALIAFLFASAYNFLESRSQNSPFRFLLALVFLGHLMANKYQLAYVFVSFLILGIFIQPKPMDKIINIWNHRQYLYLFLGSAFFVSLWYWKNYFITGVPTFPILAGQLGIWGWNIQMTDVFNKVYAGGLNIELIIKYISYLFIWSGVLTAKIVILFILSLPFILIVSLVRSNIEKETLIQLAYWFSLSVLFIIGLCLASFVDPRHYRYGTAIFVVAAVVMMDYIFMALGGAKGRLVSIFLLICVAWGSSWIIFAQGGHLKRPAIADNIAVLTNRLHFNDILERYYPDNIIAINGYRANPEKAKEAAWDTGVGGKTRFSAFLLPVQPQVGLWHTTVVGWESYDDQTLVVKDLLSYGIKWIMRVKDGQLIFISPDEYAQEVVAYDRFPSEKFYNYGFPSELSTVKY